MTLEAILGRHCEERSVCVALSIFVMSFHNKNALLDTEQLHGYKMKKWQMVFKSDWK